MNHQCADLNMVMPNRQPRSVAVLLCLLIGFVVGLVQCYLIGIPKICVRLKSQACPGRATKEGGRPCIRHPGKSIRNPTLLSSLGRVTAGDYAGGSMTRSVQSQTNTVPKQVLMLPRKVRDTISYLGIQKLIQPVGANLAGNYWQEQEEI